MKIQEAAELAFNILDTLIPYCERIHVAGSVRREKPEVKDIEIVCLPTKGKDLFGNPIVENDSSFVLAVMNIGRRLRGHFTQGRYSQIGLPEGINLDLFMPEPHDYYRQLAIRTGSADYSMKVIATGWRKIGWVGTEDGLRLGKECIPKDIGGGKTKWICTETKPTLPPVWTSEEHFFDWLGVPFIEPSQRA